MASSRGQNSQLQQKQATAPAASAGAGASASDGLRSRRRAGAGFNTGRTLQSSVSPSYRRRSTAASGARFGFGDSLARTSVQAHLRGLQEAASGDNDAASVDYGNLDELFTEAEPAPVVSRVNTETLATAKLNALSAQRADAYGNIQATPTLRQMIGFYLDTSAAGRRWDQVDALLNTAIAVLHVYNTTRVKRDQLGVPYSSLVAEAVLSGLLLVQFAPRYFLAPDPLEYLRSLFSVITLITALTPIAVVINIHYDDSIYKTFMSAGAWVFLYPVIFWRLQPALLRCLVPIKNIYHMSPMTRNVLRALTTVFTTVLAITVLTHIMVYIQNKSKNQEIQGFDEAFFFIAVSAITGLSSDIEPDTWFTRGIVLFVMFIGIFWLPPRVSEMLSLWQDRSPWPSRFVAETNQSHVLLIGDLEYTMLFEFLREFFCEDHGVRTVNTVVVVMSEKSPGKEVTELLSDPSYVNRVKFVLGSATSFSQLSSVQADKAQAIFLLSSKAAGASAAKEDAAKVMIALAVRKYLRSHGDAKRPVPIYAQVLLPETTLHLEYLTDHVICVEELRLGLLAQSVMVPGFASLLQLLTTSIPDNTTDQLVHAAERSRQKWLAEYAGSMSHEIYATRISSIFNGVKFRKAAQAIFQRTGATLFAIRVPERTEDGESLGGEGQIIINPVDYELKGDELGFVITSNSLVSTEIAYLAEAAAVTVEGEGDEDANAGDSETAPLIPGIAVSAPSGGKDDEGGKRGLAGSPLQKTIAQTEAQLKSKVPFGMNVMDTLVVSDAPPSANDDAASIDSKTDDTTDDEDANAALHDDLIDLDEDAEKDAHLEHEALGAGEAGLAPELARITVDSDEAAATSSKGKGKDKDAGDAKDTAEQGSEPAAGGVKHMQRAPLLFDPKLQKQLDTEPSAAKPSAEGTGAAPADGAAQAKQPAPEGGLAATQKVASGIFGSSAATLIPKPAATTAPPTPVKPTADGLPGDLSGHLVVCDTSGQFPSNIIYLVSCIRAAAPSEVTAIAEGCDDNADGRKEARKPENRFASLYEQISRSYNLAPAPKAQEEQEQESKAGGKSSFLNTLPIVILSSESPSDAQSEDLKRFGNLYIVNGSPLARADLARVRIHTAGSAIVLANREEALDAAADASTMLSLTGSDTTATATADAPALLTVLNIEALTYNNDDFFLSVEFIHRENMQFVGDTETIRINEVYAQAFLRPSFMSGRVYAPVMLDTLICQAYYNEYILEIMQRLIFSHGNVVHALGMAKLNEAGVEGLVYPEADNEVSSGHVFLVEVPSRFHGCSYSSLFSHCCFKHGAIPIGLYRSVVHHRQPLWYVMPNPSPNSTIREDDRVYLIADSRPVLN
ncbi:hypothetical protein GQ54DRAFT_298973 [Martensiomyces pterosporus]|nr:hypothetical protein GQ54DRAFT_298973 [Martensiomyces pterosporus]